MSEKVVDPEARRIIETERQVAIAKAWDNASRNKWGRPGARAPIRRDRAKPKVREARPAAERGRSPRSRGGCRVSERGRPTLLRSLACSLFGHDPGNVFVVSEGGSFKFRICRRCGRYGTVEVIEP